MNWKGLAVMTVLSFAAMYILMYLMVDTLRNVYPNLNQLYMTGAMTCAMLLIEVGVMGRMYSGKIRGVVAAASLLSLIGLVGAIRTEAGIGDRQFLRSMIPHHAGALLMCKEAELQDTEVKALCEEINASQQEQIGRMKQMLQRLDD